MNAPSPNRFARFGQVAVCLVTVFGWLATSEGSDNSFVYFLDGDAGTVAQDIATLTQSGQFFSTYAVIGDLSAAQRSGLAASGPRAVGKTAEIGGGNSITWSTIAPLFNGGTPPDVSTHTARQTLAGQILSNIQIDWQNADAFPQAAEAQPTPAGGYGFWAQDIENVGSQSGPDEAAAYIALMWAGRVVLGNTMKIVPVPASGIQKRTAADWNLPSVLGGVPGTDNYLSALGLADTLAPTDRQQLASIDLLSALHLVTVEDQGGIPSPLIDGFLAQQYSARGTQVNPGALPGHFSDDMFYPQDSGGDPTPTSRLLFYDGSMPYAMLSSASLQLQPIGQPTPPWTSFYDGSLPFHAGVYWDGPVDATLDPRLFLASSELALSAQLPSNGLVLPEPSLAVAAGAIGLAAAAARRLRLACTVVAIALAGWQTGATGSERPNVLLILVDDLKPALGCYGDAAAQTPHIDRLAARGMRFDRAYCNQAVCAASRYTLLLGSRSTSTGLYDLGHRLRQWLPGAVTLPQFFSCHGYRSESLGKVFHVGHGNVGDPESFDVPPFSDLVIEYRDPASRAAGGLTREEALFANERLGEIGSLPCGRAFESPSVDDEAYADGRVATETIVRLRQAVARRQTEGTPFLIAAGFVRPHLPFSVPKKYWDQHDPAALPAPGVTMPPEAAPASALKRGGEITAYEPVPEDGRVDEPLARQLVHGYYASVSYVDAQIGRVLAEVEQLGLFENTIVVLWGDHGFHLGDHGFWTKHTNYEQATRIPLIVVAPGVTHPNTLSQQLVESVDLYPTLAELAGLPRPEGPQPIDGQSLAGVLADPDHRLERSFAQHCFPRGERLGRGLRTDRFRLVEWRAKDPATAVEYELYDYATDPLETRNLAGERPDVVRQLAGLFVAEPAPVPPGSQPPPPTPR